MLIFLVADKDKSYNASAYCFKVGNFQMESDRRTGWTVVEAYLHGFNALSHYIIKKGIYRSVTGFDFCVASNAVIKLVETDYLDQLYVNNWKSPDKKPLFHVPILKELYYHKLYYTERNVHWHIVTDVSDMDYKTFEMCREHVKALLEEK